MGTFNSRFDYVSVSRASHDAQIYTNNTASLAESLSHDVSKASAVDFGKVKSPVADTGLEQAAALKKNLLLASDYPFEVFVLGPPPCSSISSQYFFR